MDAELVERLCAADDEATVTIVARLRPRLEGLARLRGFSAEDAEEIAQDTLLAVLTQLRQGRFEARSQLTSWIRAIFDRRAVDYYRKARRHTTRTTSLDALPRHEAEEATGMTSARDSATTLLVREALAHLAPKHRLVLLLNTNEGVPAREIATMLRLGVKTTEALLTTARKQFRLQVALAQETRLPLRLNK